VILPNKSRLEPEEEQELVAIAHEFGVEIKPIVGEVRTIYAIIGDESSSDLIKRFEGLNFVERVNHIQVPYKILCHENDGVAPKIVINGKTVGKDFIVIAGHCTIDPKNPQLFIETAHAVKEAGADMLRGGVWKPRTSPYAFRGDARSLATLLKAREETGLQVVTEVMELDHVGLCVSHKVDAFQVGARNALNYSLLTQIGQMTAQSDTKVLLKRSIHMGPINELILAAEYIAGNGNRNVMVCPRGTLPNIDGYRNYPDESITPLIKEKSWVPVIVDPSHSVGKAKYVPHAALAAAAYGADGVIVETHINPRFGAGDDPKQAVTPEMLAKIIEQARAIHDNLKLMSK